ncbi:hypothetical protein D3C73_904170 [compost metagenome]
MICAVKCARIGRRNCGKRSCFVSESCAGRPDIHKVRQIGRHQRVARFKRLVLGLQLLSRSGQRLMQHLSAKVIRHLRTGIPGHLQAFADILAESAVNAFEAEGFLDHFFVGGITAGCHYNAFARNLKCCTVRLLGYYTGYFSVSAGNQLLGCSLCDDLAAVLFY